MMKAAVELIAERGYQLTSLQAIGERAGYSRGLVSHRFGSKDGLLRALVRELLDGWGEAKRDPAIGRQVGVQALAAVAREHRKAFSEAPDHMRALYTLMSESRGELTEVRAEFAALDRKHRAMVESLLRAGQRNGSVTTELAPEPMAVLFMALLRGITTQWLIDPEAIDLDAVYLELQRLLTRGLGA